MGGTRPGWNCFTFKTRITLEAFYAGLSASGLPRAKQEFWPRACLPPAQLRAASRPGRRKPPLLLDEGAGGNGPPPQLEGLAPR
jgi:hypothetical protein